MSVATVTRERAKRGLRRELGGQVGSPSVRLEVPVLNGGPAAKLRATFDAEAMAQLDALFGFALKLTRARDEAEDLVSETMLRAFERWEQYRLGTNIRGWLFTILYHAFVSRKRRIDAREVQPPEDKDRWGGYELVGDADPERTFYDSFIDDEVTRAIERLPSEYSSAVVMSDLHGMRYAEIAERLGVPEGTVKSRLFRGRRMLQKDLAGYAVEMGYIKARTLDDLHEPMSDVEAA